MTAPEAKAVAASISTGRIALLPTEWRDMVTALVADAVGAGMRAAYKHAAESSDPLPHRPYRLATVDELTEAWEAMTSEDVSYFIQSWNDCITGQDFACPKAATGLHEEIDGVCENCGANREETPT